ncbi:hypothetical protein V6Z11_D05G346700 [Gossypium hirsutum]
MIMRGKLVILFTFFGVRTSTSLLPLSYPSVGNRKRKYDCLKNSNINLLDCLKLIKLICDFQEKKFRIRKKNYKYKNSKIIKINKLSSESGKGRLYLGLRLLREHSQIPHQSTTYRNQPQVVQSLNFLAVWERGSWFSAIKKFFFAAHSNLVLRCFIPKFVAHSNSIHTLNFTMYICKVDNHIHSYFAAHRSTCYKTL